MKKEDWINSIIETASDIKEVDTNPFLYEKIMHRVIEPERIVARPLKFNPRWAVAILLVIVLNVTALVLSKSKTHKQKEDVAIEVLSKQMITNTNYNY